MKFIKHPANPILTANPKNDWESLCVLNPAVYYEENDKTFYMLYRAAGHDETHYIHLGLATSKDGVNFKREFNHPVLSPDINGADGGCVEDPRIVKFGDFYYVTYASRTFPPGQYWLSNYKPLGDRPEHGPLFAIKNNTVTHLAITRDFVNFKKLGRITDSRIDDRDVIIFPEKVNNKFVRLSRPMEYVGKEFGCENPSIWISFSDDLMEWEKPQLLMTGQEWWEDKKVGGSTPPIKTEAGWLHIYHGVSTKDHAYRVGAVLLDLNDPTKIIARTKDFLMEPEYDYETQGYYNGCVFPTGNCVVDDTLYVYYGAADKYVCLATCKFSELVNYLVTKCKVE
ncbi:MAG: glycosidase [Bacilli bacterium]|nr:glycosidase [Bacilli bacterium]